jgi:hypothetical protein
VSEKVDRGAVGRRVGRGGEDRGGPERVDHLGHHVRGRACVVARGPVDGLDVGGAHRQARRGVGRLATRERLGPERGLGATGVGGAAVEGHRAARRTRRGRDGVGEGRRGAVGRRVGRGGEDRGGPERVDHLGHHVRGRACVVARGPVDGLDVGGAHRQARRGVGRLATRERLGPERGLGATGVGGAAVEGHRAARRTRRGRDGVGEGRRGAVGRRVGRGGEDRGGPERVDHLGHHVRGRACVVARGPVDGLDVGGAHRQARRGVGRLATRERLGPERGLGATGVGGAAVEGHRAARRTRRGRDGVGEGRRGAVGRRVGRGGEDRGGPERRGSDHLAQGPRGRAGEVPVGIHVRGRDRMRTACRGRVVHRALRRGRRGPRRGDSHGVADDRAVVLEGHRPRRAGGNGVLAGGGRSGHRRHVGDALADGRGVLAGGQARRGAVDLGVVGTSRVDEVVAVVLAVVLGGAVVLQLDGHAGTGGVAAPAHIERTREGRQHQAGPGTIRGRRRVVRGVEGGRDALDRDGRLQVVVDTEDHAASCPRVEEGRRARAGGRGVDAARDREARGARGQVESEVLGDGPGTEHGRGDTERERGDDERDGTGCHHRLRPLEPL